jgi:hypothetical protein
MRYMASIYVSDVMDLVALTLELNAWEAQYGPPELIASQTFTWAGIGEDDPLEWLKRALTLACSDLTAHPRRDQGAPPGIGGTYTISGSGDRAS